VKQPLPFLQSWWLFFSSMRRTRAGEPDERHAAHKLGIGPGAVLVIAFVGMFAAVPFALGTAALLASPLFDSGLPKLIAGVLFVAAVVSAQHFAHGAISYAIYRIWFRRVHPLR
jgi:hypothetical protein